MGLGELLAATWAGVPEGTEPERFALRRDWLLERVDPAGRVLDLGCGEGAFAAALAAHGADVVGVDVVPEPLRRARARHPALDLRLGALDRPLPLEEAAVDVVWAGEVLEHLADPVGALHELRRVLRPGGRLLATTPDHPPALLRALADDPAALAAHLDPRADHLRFFTAGTLGALVRDLGFQDVEVASDGTTLFLETRW